jgi:iron(III) transport system ATP-binding protein
MSLILKNIVKDFDLPKKKSFRAVDHVDLDIPEGEFCTLLGPSGCGKTTLLRMVAGFESPTSGDILHNGKRINEIPPNQRGFSMVFQSYALFPHMNVKDNIAYGLKIKKMPKDQIKTKVQKMIELLGLQENAVKYPAQMSGGQQQRVALARALVMEPKIILFDEPLSNLDAKLRHFMRDEIRSLQQRLGITALYVTHDQEEAMAISDKIVVLNKGKIEQMGSALDVYQKPATEFVAKFVGIANMITVKKRDGHVQVLDKRIPLSGSQLPTKAVLRPEHLFIDPKGESEGTLESKNYLGPKTSYTVDCGGQKLFIESEGFDPNIKAGEKVKVSFDQSSLHFM